MSLRDIGAQVSGHGWTIGTWLRWTLRPGSAPPSSPWSAMIDDPLLGPVRLTGRIRHEPSQSLVVVVHGLGGDIEAPYVVAAAQAAHVAGISCLRLNLRGADRSGEDFYHAGLTADLTTAIASAEVARYKKVFVLGYSLGGHVTLRYGLEAADTRLAALAAVSAPLDLDVSARWFDRPGCEIYRRNVLLGLYDIYASVARRRPVPLPVGLARRIRKIREWDHRVVAPRHGFRDAEDYYRSVSVAPRLRELETRSLLIFARNDPMVPAEVVSGELASCHARTTVKWIERGGHMAFPSKLDLAYPGALGLEGQIMSWFEAQMD